MLVSGGQLVLAESTPTRSAVWHPTDGLNLTGLHASYGSIYRRQLWVHAVVRKRALATRRLPLKVYNRTDDGRAEARDHQLATLLRNPNPRTSGAQLWEWTSSTFDVYGEAFWLKVRDRDGRPVQLYPLHPSNLDVRVSDDGALEYVYGPGVQIGSPAQLVFPEADVVHFRTYSPDGTVRGLSTLEPLRQTLLNEDAARRASSAFWQNGGRPSGFLSHPANLSDDALRRLRDQWESMHGGVDNFGKFAILEEGMEPKVLSMSAEDAQYIDSRRLNREEVCAAYDVPPPVVHILDRATFSNITEQMRSMYRDTMAPHLGGFEATLMFTLVPDFEDTTLYVEFLMDEVLRGDFETRVTAYQAGVNSGWLTPNEVRAMENLEGLPGGDALFVNSTLVPLAKTEGAEPRELAEMVQKVYLGVGKVITADEARALLDRAGAGLGNAPPALPQVPEGNAAQARSLDAFWGRLGRASTLDELDPDVLTADLNGHASEVRALLDEARERGDTVADFRTLVRSALT